MNGEIYNSLRIRLRDKEYAEGYAESFLNSYIATQIKVLREQRNMTQADLAREIGTTQAGVSRMENVDYSSWSKRTLTKLSRAFGVRLKVSFEPYGTLPNEVVEFSRSNLERVAIEEDPGLKESSSQENSVTDIGAYKALSGIGQQKHARQRIAEVLGEGGFQPEEKSLGSYNIQLPQEQQQPMEMRSYAR